MPAVEPADPARMYVSVNGGDDAAVIDINRHGRRRHGAIAAARGRWATMRSAAEPHHPGPPPAPAIRTAQAEFAEYLEESFNLLGYSLSDEKVAAVFRNTVDVVGRVLEGSHATGIINQDQLTELQSVVGGMREAPGLI
jgi:hypothetical protein